MIKKIVSNAEDLGSVPGLGRSPGGGQGSPLQYSCLETPRGWRSLVGYSPWGCKESDMAVCLSTTVSNIRQKIDFTFHTKSENVFGFMEP